MNKKMKENTRKKNTNTNNDDEAHNNRSKKECKRVQWWQQEAEEAPEKWLLHVDEWGWNQLMEAAALLNYEQCLYLINVQKVDVNLCTWCDGGYNALFALTLSNWFGRPTEVVRICKLLLDSGINVYHRNGEGYTFVEHIDKGFTANSYYISRDSDRNIRLLSTLKTLVSDRM